MGLVAIDFYRMTWREYMLTMKGFATKRSHEFEHTRAIVYNNIAINRDPKKPFPTIDKFWPLPTDNNEASEIENEAEGKRLLEKLQKFKKENLHNKWTRGSK